MHLFFLRTRSKYILLESSTVVNIFFVRAWSNHIGLGRARSSTIFRRSTVGTYLASVKHKRAFFCSFCSCTVETYLAWVENGRSGFFLFEHGQNICRFGRARSSPIFSFEHDQKIFLLGPAPSAPFLFQHRRNTCCLCPAWSKFTLLGSRKVETFFWSNTVEHNLFGYSTVKTCLVQVGDG